MEGKGVGAPFTAFIMGALILGLVVAQIEAKSCCKTTAGRNCYNVCRVPGTPRPVCANLCDCIIIEETTCPPTHPRSSMLENYVDEVIEEVTTDAKVPPFKVWCPTPEAQSCFSICRLPEKLCVERCGCLYSPRGN